MVKKKGTRSRNDESSPARRRIRAKRGAKSRPGEATATGLGRNKAAAGSLLVADEQVLKEALQRSGFAVDLFDITLSSIGDFAYVFDKEGRFLYANRALADLLQLKPDAMVGKNFHDLGYPPELANKLQAQIQQVLKRNETLRDETAFTSPGGVHGYYEYLFHPVVSPNGKVEAVAGTTRDLTERRQVEEALKASEERFRQFAENSAHVVWIVDAGHRHLEYLSPAFEKIWGMSRAPILKNIDHWRKTLHVDDRGKAATVLPRVLKGDTIVIEYRITRASDRSERWIRDLGFPIRNSDGLVVRVGGIAEDITEDKARAVALRGSEERFRILVEGARDYAMFLLDGEGRITFWSAGAEKIFGWTAREAEGKPGSLIFTPEDRKKGEVEREIGTAAAEGRALDRRWHLRKDGSRVWMDGVLMRLEEDDGVSRYAKIARDATEQRKGEEALQQAHAELEQRVADRTKELQAMNDTLEDEMTRRKRLEREVLNVTERERARISQDLHDSLCQELTATAFILKSQAIAVAKESANAAEVLRESARTVNENAGLARDLARGMHPPELGTAGLVSALQELAARASERVTCRCDCPRALRVPNTNLAVNLYRIAQEAVTNALKHAKPTEVVICIEREKDEIILAVSDDGKQARKRKEKGLGIRMMQYRASVSGGSLTIEPVEGGGTKVKCRVPLKA